ncbi:AbrB family transcriptional regulator [soil metagenome]
MNWSQQSRTAARGLGLRWIALLVLSVVFVLVFQAAGLAAASLLGPMAAGIALASRVGKLRVPAQGFMFAQGIIGLLIARNVPASILAEMSHVWPALVISIGAVVAASALLGYLLAERQTLPGTTAIWGFFPGGASAMVLMAGEFGADARLVAFMQYLRVVLVAVVASLVARIWLPHSNAAVVPAPWFPSHDGLALVETLALAMLGSWTGRKLRLPAGALLVPMIVGILLQDTGLLAIELPRWLLTAAYALVGWSIGLRFTPAVLSHAWSALPRVLLSMLLLIAICGGFAGLLTLTMNVDPMTAYLATSPGGIDAVAIIAASSTVDMPFVMAMQTGRLLAVLIAGPAIARWLAGRITAHASARPAAR